MLSLELLGNKNIIINISTAFVNVPDPHFCEISKRFGIVRISMPTGSESFYREHPADLHCLHEIRPKLLLR